MKKCSQFSPWIIAVVLFVHGCATPSPNPAELPGPIAQTPPFDRRELVEQVVRDSGLQAAVASIPAMLQAQYEQRKLTAQDTDIEKAVSQILAQSFDPVRANKIAVETVMTEASLTHLEQTLHWLQSPLGRRFTAAEVPMLSSDSQTGLLEYTADLQRHAPRPSALP